MFYCIGENSTESGYMGVGETIEAAILDWASDSDISEAISEFRQYDPVIIEGAPIEVSINVSFTAAKK